MAEGKFQAKVADWLRKKGCYVIITDGRPVGVPDVAALCDGGGWVTLETKAKNPFKKDGTPLKGAFQPLQLVTIEKLDKMYYSRPVWPEIWEEVKDELSKII